MSFILQENSFFLLLESGGQMTLTTPSGATVSLSGYIDIALAAQTDGGYDISLDSDGDIAKTGTLYTAILMSICTDKRADASEVSPPQYRRGWWGNLLNDVQGYEIGSKLWLLDQSRKTQDTLNRAQSYITDSLQWLIDDGYVSGVTVTVTKAQTGIQADIQFN
jgi:phage gp46-like protein